MDVKTIAEKWKKHSGDLSPPKIFMAYDSEDKKYFVIQDYGAIVYMVIEKSNITYTIPKKYLTLIDEKYYKINNQSKLISVTCRARNRYEQFVQKYLL
jgi:hypothetical protein